MKPRATISEMVDAIRADSVVGCGTCSTIDEAFTEAELIAFIGENGCRSTSGAVKAAREFEKLHSEYDCGLSPEEREENSHPTDASDDDYLYPPHHEFDADFEGRDCASSGRPWSEIDAECEAFWREMDATSVTDSEKGDPFAEPWGGPAGDTIKAAEFRAKQDAYAVKHGYATETELNNVPF